MMNTQDRTSNYQADSLSLVGAISLGTGVMIGAGIFALTGQMAEMTGSLFPLAFLSAALIVSTGVGRIRGLVYGDPGHAGHSGRHHRQHFRGVSHAGHADQDEIGAPQSLRNARQHSECIRWSMERKEIANMGTNIEHRNNPDTKRAKHS